MATNRSGLANLVTTRLAKQTETEQEVARLSGYINTCRSLANKFEVLKTVLLAGPVDQTSVDKINAINAEMSALAQDWSNSPWNKA